MSTITIDDVSLLTDAQPSRVAVIGRGPYGVAMFDALMSRGVDVVMGVRANAKTSQGAVVLIHPDSTITRRLTNCGKTSARVVDISTAITHADVILLCIPYKSHASFVAGNAEILKTRGQESKLERGRGLTIIDTSNSTEKYQDTSIAQRLEKALTTHNVNTEDNPALVNVVKAFNTVSAYTIGQCASLKGSSDMTPICGDSEVAKAMASSIGSTIGLRPFDIGPLSCALNMELLGFSFFSKWGRTAALTGMIYLFFVVYCAIWYMAIDFPALAKPAYDWGQPMVLVNKAMANTALVLLAATYLPGRLANCLQLYKRSARVLFPRWLSSWLQIRKQLGLTAVFLVVLHGILTAFCVSGAYGFLLPFGNANVEQPNRQMNLLREVVLLLGIAAFVLLVPILLSSLPSISAGMTWREWSCIQKTVGHVALLLSGLHAGSYFLSLYSCVYPANAIASPSTQASSCNYVVPILSNYPAYLPPPASISAFISLVVCALYFVLSIPYVERSTWAIRNGSSGKNPMRKLSSASCVVTLKPGMEGESKAPRTLSETPATIAVVDV